MVKKSGSWFSYGQDKLGQGREAAKKALREDRSLFQQIYVQVRELMTGTAEIITG